MNLRELNEEIAKTGKTFHITIAGGGYGFLDPLTSIGGSSSFFNGCSIPNSIELSKQIVGEEKIVSEKSARLMAKHSKKFADIGIGVTASLHKMGQRDGRLNHVYICVNDGKNNDYYVEFDPEDKDEMCRTWQEISLASIVHCVIINMFGVEVRPFWLNVVSDTKTYKLPEELEKLMEKLK